MNDKVQLRGLILNGGKSSRMGFDKSEIVYHDDVPQLEWARSLLLTVCLNVVVSCKRGATLPEGFFPLYDAFDFESPLNGILTALNHDTESAWLTIPVDMPGITASSIEQLVKRRDPSKLATCFYDIEGTKPEPLVTIWEPHSRNSLNDFHAQGKISPRNFLVSHSVCILPSPSREFHKNINTVKDLELFKNENRDQKS